MRSAHAIVLVKKLLSIAFFHEMCSASDFQTVLNYINKSIYLQMLTQSVWPISSFRLKKYSILKIAQNKSNYYNLIQNQFSFNGAYTVDRWHCVMVHFGVHVY